ncbi:MAG: CAP domain-containing protein [Gaiellaceae bacterium]
MLALALLIAVLSLAQGDVAGAQTKVTKRAAVTDMTRYEKRLAAAINATRKRHGLCTLRLVPGLMRSAGKHSLQMAVKGYFAHSSANGASFFTRVRSFYGGNISAGENLLWAQPQVAPRRVVSLWMASPGHRTVLLSRTWRVFGVGVVSARHGAGVFGGRRVMLVTADFAVKR